MLKGGHASLFLVRHPWNWFALCCCNTASPVAKLSLSLVKSVCKIIVTYKRVHTNGQLVFSNRGTLHVRIKHKIESYVFVIMDHYEVNEASRGMPLFSSCCIPV